MPSLKQLLAFFAIFGSIFFSCTSTKKEDKKVYLELNDQLEHSTQIIKESSLIYLRHLDSKTYDPHTAERAKAWFAKASQVQQLTLGIFNYLVNVKQSIKSNSNSKEGDKLIEMLTSLVSKLSSIDTNMTKEFKLQIDSLPKSQDSITIFSSNLSSEAILCLISKLQNRISILESRLVAYCDNNVSSNYDGFYTMFPFINQNLTHLNRDEELEINVGVGYLNYPSYPKIYVNGDTISSTKNGIFNYKMKVSGGTGKYSVPIKIEYYDYLKKITVNKTIEYFIN